MCSTRHGRDVADTDRLCVSAIRCTACISGCASSSCSVGFVPCSVKFVPEGLALSQPGRPCGIGAYVSTPASKLVWLCGYLNRRQHSSCFGMHHSLTHVQHVHLAGARPTSVSPAAAAANQGAASSAHLVLYVVQSHESQHFLHNSTNFTSTGTHNALATGMPAANITPPAAAAVNICQMAAAAAAFLLAVAAAAATTGADAAEPTAGAAAACAVWQAQPSSNLEILQHLHNRAHP